MFLSTKVDRSTCIERWPSRPKEEEERVEVVARRVSMMGESEIVKGGPKGGG